MQLANAGRIAFIVLGAAALLSCRDLPTVNAPLARTHGVANLVFGSPGNVVVSQVYGGGGNASATYKNDFVELFNRSGVVQSLAGWSIQYASASGTGNFASNPVVSLSGTINPGQYVLVSLAGGATGAALTPDIVGPTGLNMSGSAGKVIVASTTTGLACNGGSTACSAAQLAQIVDLVGYGANFFEGSAAAPGTANNTVAATRKNGGCLDTQENSTDIASAAVTPRNRASARNVCPGTVPVGPLDHVKMSGASATVYIGGTTQLGATPQDTLNQTVGAATVTWTSSDEHVATVDNTGLVTGVAVGTATITARAVQDTITRTGTTQVTASYPSIGWVDFTPRSTSFPPGFQTEAFVTARAASGGVVIPATFTFESVDPQYGLIVPVNDESRITAVSADPAPAVTKPGFRITATPTGGGASYTFVSHAITVEVPVIAPTSIYGNNEEFGLPTPAASDPNDLLIRRTQYTLSYNESRGTPNWVSYELDSRQMVAGQDRCNCFTADPNLPADKQIFTTDYTGGGYDRGHMARSADRTAANVDNATTFYLTNIVPQTAALNQGVWAHLENALADSAKAGRAVYIVTGPIYSRPLKFLKDSGKVAIPDSTWKVALIGPRNTNPFSRADVTTWNDLQGLTILAVKMPNTTTASDPWSQYLTTTDAIEASTGFDFLNLLQTAFQDALEANDHAPTASFSSSGTTDEGAAITFDASASADADIGRADLGRTEALTYEWHFSDGTSATGAVVSKTFMQDGAYTATLTVSDAFGWPATQTQALSIANVAPVVSAFDGATLLTGETYAANGTFTDPGADPWTATVDYGTGAAPLALSGKSFSLSHVYGTAGTFTVTVTVNDGLANGSASASVVVLTPAQGLAELTRMTSALPGLNPGEANSLAAKLRAVRADISRGQAEAAGNGLGAYINEIEAMVQSGRLTQDAGAAVIAYAQRIIAATG